MQEQNYRYMSFITSNKLQSSLLLAYLIIFKYIIFVAVQNMAHVGERPAVRTQHSHAHRGGTETYHSTTAQENQRVQIPH